jgi:uncharacterized SAM-binding protein YcdF (DUF218 family)
VDACPSADAIVVLSGGIVRGTNIDGVQWGESANRYFAGLNLAMAGKARVLVLSAGLPNPGGYSQGDVLQQDAIRHGLPAERIIVTQAVLTTEDESRAVSNMANIHSVLLVTSAFHMSRAVLLFRARGLNVSPFPTDQRMLGPGPQFFFKFIPVSSSLQDSEQAMREYYGLFVYRILLSLK